MQLQINTKKYGVLNYQIDEEDLHIIQSNKVYAVYMKHTNSYYLITDNKKYIHRLITNANKGQEVDHINHNTLDNRRCNLKVVSHKENRLNNKKFYTDTYKITKEQIKEILLSNLTNSVLSKKYNISNCLVSKIKTGDMYSNVFPEIPRKQKQSIITTARTIEEKQIIKKLVSDGIKLTIIKDKYNISLPELYRIKNNKQWKNV